MDFILFKKTKERGFDISNKYAQSFNIFQNRGQKLSKIIETEHFHISLFDGLNTACFYKIFENGDFIVTLGTLIYKENFGEEVLQILYKDIKSNKSDLYNDLMGGYCVITCIDGQIFVFNDFLGLKRVYYNEDESIYSSSFLAITKAIPQKTKSEQEIFEYLIRGGMYGDKTVLKEIKLIPRSTLVCVNNKQSNRTLKYTYNKLPFFDNFNKMVDYATKEYIQAFEIIVKIFGVNITTALSGGYDTRFMLSLLRVNGITPTIYVYGGDNSSDVKIAKSIAKGEGFHIEHINRELKYPIEITEYKEIVESNFYYFDGLSNGGIFDNGMDIVTRKNRSDGGMLQLNGAGGEIWRNFWMLNKYNKRPIDFVRHKWDIYDYTAYTETFDKVEYFKNFTKKLLKSIELPEDIPMITRKQMEMSYPLYRYRYWQSLGNSTNLLFSNSLMPLMETRFLYPSFDIPIEFKYNGRFEAAMIEKVDKRMAKYNSNYGFNFMGQPPFKDRSKNFVLRNIPLIIKPLLRNKFSKKNKEIKPYFLDGQYSSQFFDLNDLIISEYVDIKKLNNPASLSRALSLEYFLRNI